jgi:hypothetical protein
MKNLKIKNLFIILFASLTIVSCSDDDDDKVEPVVTPPVVSATVDKTYEVTNTGATVYNFNFTTLENPELELTRGKTYEFKVNSPGHPFLINKSNTLGTADTYDAGVSNNGTASGSILFTVPVTAPDILWYNCEFHVPMAGRIRVVDAAETRAFQVGNSGAAAYTFSGEGFSNVENTNFTFKRGATYTFTVATPGHPFLIKSVQSTGTADSYNDGVTNNGAASGAITFTVPQNAPNTLFYVCEFHGPMTGTIAIVD